MIFADFRRFKRVLYIIHLFRLGKKAKELYTRNFLGTVNAVILIL